MKRYISILLAVIVTGCVPTKSYHVEDIDKGGECVVLLHGLGRTNRAMSTLDEELHKAGYTVVNMSYPSRSKSIEELSDEYFPQALKYAQSYRYSKIHFVTHSLGGIIARQGLQKNQPENIGNIVMIAPPNQGSEAAQYLLDSWMLGWFYKWWFGPAGKQLGIGEKALPPTIPALPYPIGIIAGNKHSWVDGYLAWQFPGENDGKVSLERAKLKEMQDFIVVPYNHIVIMKKPEVIKQVLHFLREGKFEK